MGSGVHFGVPPGQVTTTQCHFYSAWLLQKSQLAKYECCLVNRNQIVSVRSASFQWILWLSPILNSWEYSLYDLAEGVAHMTPLCPLLPNTLNSTIQSGIFKILKKEVAICPCLCILEIQHLHFMHFLRCLLWEELLLQVLKHWMCTLVCVWCSPCETSD